MAAKKQEIVPEQKYAQCAGNPGCRFPGLLWVRTLAPDERLCVNHYYRALDEDSSLAKDDFTPPRMAGVRPKAVAGNE